MSPTWTVVLPVKHAEAAKSRLVAPRGVDRVALARAIALDSCRAARRCTAVRRVVVVSGDPVVSAAATPLGDVVADPGGGLLAAVRSGLAATRGGTPVAVLLADVPALTPEALQSALLECSRHPVAFVPDLEGSGTVLLATTGETRLSPAFGPDSAARHAAAGAVRLDLDLPCLRRDVDTWDDLLEALGLGVGAATTTATSSVAG